MVQSVFKENQRFNQPWLWILLVVSVVLFLLGLIYKHSNGESLRVSGIVIALIAMILIVGLFLRLSLETRIDQYAIQFRYPPFINQWRKIDRETIQSAHVEKYSPWTYGGWGIRYSGNGWAYNVRGNTGIIIKKKNGRQLLIGTQQPLKAKEAIRNLLNPGDGIE